MSPFDGRAAFSLLGGRAYQQMKLASGWQSQPSMDHNLHTKYLETIWLNQETNTYEQDVIATWQYYTWEYNTPFFSG
jgi:hypothetical protein